MRKYQISLGTTNWSHLYGDLEVLGWLDKGRPPEFLFQSAEMQMATLVRSRDWSALGMDGGRHVFRDRHLDIPPLRYWIGIGRFFERPANEIAIVAAEREEFKWGTSHLYIHSWRGADSRLLASLRGTVIGALADMFFRAGRLRRLPRLD